MNGPCVFIPERIQACAQQMFSHADVLEHEAYVLLMAARSMDWYGFSREAFQAELERKAQQMISAGEEMRTLALRAIHTLENVQETDAFYTHEYSLLIFGDLEKKRTL